MSKRKPPQDAPVYSHVLCNRCNAARPLGEHPCAACRCPEYRLVEDVGAKGESRAGVDKG